MLKLHAVHGNTFAIETPSAFLPVYKLTERDIVLLDTGYAATDRAPLDELLEASGFQVKGVFCTHAHLDHSGNVRYLSEKYSCRVAAHLIEGAIAATPDSFLAHYDLSTPDGRGGLEECFSVTDCITPNTENLDFCGVTFGILQLPGHSSGHIGIVTPDGVAYLGDALMGWPELASSKMPTTQFLKQDLESKRSLHRLQAKAYILAHKAILTDIHTLIDANVACYEAKARDILAALGGSMTRGEWLTAYCESQRLNIRSQRSFVILEYGFNSVVTYLADLGLVEPEREGGVRRYRKSDR